MEALPYLAVLCTWGWSQSSLSAGGVSVSPSGPDEYMYSCLTESLMATYGSVLVELWVWGEAIRLQVVVEYEK